MGGLQTLQEETAMTSFTIRYSGRGTKVLRTEIVTAENISSAVAQAKRRVKASQTFREAHVFEDDDFNSNGSPERSGFTITGDESPRL